jgi:hypothetical protein
VVILHIKLVTLCREYGRLKYIGRSKLTNYIINVYFENKSPWESEALEFNCLWKFYETNDALGKQRRFGALCEVLSEYAAKFSTLVYLQKVRTFQLSNTIIEQQQPLKYNIIGPHQPVKWNTIQLDPSNQLNELLYNWTHQPVKWTTIQLDPSNQLNELPYNWTPSTSQMDYYTIGPQQPVKWTTIQLDPCNKVKWTTIQLDPSNQSNELQYNWTPATS